MKKILIIDDDLDICTLLNRFLSRKGFEVETANTGHEGIRAAEARPPALILTDFRLGDMDGSEVLQQLRQKLPHVPVLVMTGYSDIRMAVHVLKLGAVDYITKPIIPDEILLSIQNALAAEVLPHTQNPVAASGPSRSSPTSTRNSYIISQSAAAQAMYKQIDLVAPTNYSVILYGESGSGKESIARMIHDRSTRAGQPFVAMDCGAISKDLANSELFGHEKGSFTGALGTKIGHFEAANGGTLFLDEVSNLPYDVQVSLLRVVQERRLKRIGSAKEIALDVRIIVASNERLLTACRKGKFREDLYHRFNEFSLELPPLRERSDDIMPFAQHFLQETARELNKPIQGFSDDVAHIFTHYPWYGNVRELKNVIKRAALLTDGARVEAMALPFEITHFHKLTIDDPGPAESLAREQPIWEPPAQFAAAERTAAVSAPPVPQHVVHMIPEKTDLKAAANVAEYDMIMRVLQEVRFNKSKAAQTLGIDRKTLYNKLKAYNIQ
ncbi:MAG: sigma-54-dependent Fis family transcriptional regulator [Saprospiraceae bacterium]|nr:sigma-54-dependent Fis family transcriptional regulator [Saprospiraceae bacterium]